LTAPTYGASYGEGKVQGVAKVTQTGILWSTVQVCHALPFITRELLSAQFAHRAEALYWRHS
jgi:hypothetical protein